MKVYLPALNKPPTTGKGFFYNRLAQHLSDYVDVSCEDVSYDIAVNNVRVRDIRAKCQVVRIDGVYHDTGKNYRQLNKQIFKGFHKAPDGVIYQSNFSRMMADKYIGATTKPFKVIHNGADPGAYEYVKAANKQHEYNFFTFSRWRPHKRLREIVESFLEAGIEDSCLYVAGDLSKAGVDKKWKKRYLSHDKVRYLGVINQQEISSYLKIMNAVMHLCWFDSCPNSVVESISAGVPVISNNIGGTAEIVKEANGYVCDIDKHTLKPVDLYHPPRVDKTKIIKALRASMTEKRIIHKDHVDIKNIAKEYYNFFESLLNE